MSPRATSGAERLSGLFSTPFLVRMYGKRIHEAPTIWFAKNNGLLRRTFGGWEISGIVTRQSGQPFSILTGVDSNGNGAGGDRARGKV